jgi:aspartyl-tRNA(Asn)/glutamyl-tRNA(Gln) amidotransferase subunit A
LRITLLKIQYLSFLAKPLIIAPYPHSEMPYLTTPRGDLHTTRLAIQSGHSTAALETALSLDIAQSAACQHAFLSLDLPGANAAAQAASQSQAFAGLAVSVKDLFDVAGQVTAAGSTVLAGGKAAAADCPAVARLKAAGGAVLGRTNMVEFAFSGVGCNPHHGTPVNPCDMQVARIPGGSSSGAAVSVASGAAFVGLGSDTGGSLRIPAALCGIVGFKPTARTVPTDGAVPLSTTLDTVGALTRSVRDAITAHEVLSAQAVATALPDLRTLKLAVAHTTMLDGLEPAVAQAFERSLHILRAAGAQIENIKLPEIADLGSIQSRGGFSAPEAQAWQRARGLWPQRQGEYDPRVAQRIAMADNMTASDYVTLHTARLDWIQRTSRALSPYAAVLSPTVPITAPPIASLAPATGQDAALDAQRDAEFWRVNGLLLRNTSVVNLLDGCAISLPCQLPSELPVGLMLWHGAMRDNTVLQLALWVEAQLARPLQK